MRHDNAQQRKKMQLSQPGDTWQSAGSTGTIDSSIPRSRSYNGATDQLDPTYNGTIALRNDTSRLLGNSSVTAYTDLSRATLDRTKDPGSLDSSVFNSYQEQ